MEKKLDTVGADLRHVKLCSGSKIRSDMEERGVHKER